MDASLRELGVSDLSVGKKIKVLAENFMEDYLTTPKVLIK